MKNFFGRYLENAKKMVGISKSKTTVQKYQRCYNRLADFMKSEYHVSVNCNACIMMI